MNVAVYDIVWLRVPFELSHDIRPCVVIRLEPNNCVTVLRVSSAMPLYDPYRHFKLSPTRPEFAATGLSKESFCDDSKFFTVNVDTIRKRSGSITGEWCREFDKWLGLAG